MNRRLFCAGAILLGIATTITGTIAETPKSVKNISEFSDVTQLQRFKPGEIEIARLKLAEADEKTRQLILSQICDQSPGTELCSVLPNDNTDFSELFVYSFILPSAQNSFDVFSWQSFVGLNWPSDNSGVPLNNSIGTAPQAPRRWMNYKTPQQIFNPASADSICNHDSNDGVPILRTSTFFQTGGLPLIDRNLNYVVYDIRINSQMADYITENGLDTISGQKEFAAAGGIINFPLGHYDDPINKTGGTAPSTAIKSAWKIIDEESGDDATRYYTINGLVEVAPEFSETGTAMCHQVRLGLVGMHIMSRTKSGNGPDWTWSTFEHVDNAPFASNARKPIDTLHKDLFKDGCSAPLEDPRDYSFFNAACKDCTTNSIGGGNWKWSASKPYAASHAIKGRFGSQTVRCWTIFEGTEVVNGIWQSKLQGTVWENYDSSSAQWKGARINPMFPRGEVPRFLVNSSMETYDQYSHDSSCLGCHASAVSMAGQETNFSFLLGLAGKYSTE